MKKLGFGLMRLPLLDKEDQSRIDIETVKKMVDTFMKNGFTYFDTAYSYHQGKSEVAFNEAVVKRYPRSSYTITDKLSLFMLKDEKELEEVFNGQLHRLGLEYIDYYFIHGVNEMMYHQAQKMNAFEFLKRKKDEGKIRHIGLSFCDKATLLDQILTDHPELEYVQIKLNYLDWEDPAFESKRCYEVAAKHHKPVIVIEPMKGGDLIDIPDEAKRVFKKQKPDASLVSWAIRFAASQDYVMMVLSDMNSEEQMEDNISYMKDFRCLNEVELETVQKVVRIIRCSIPNPCIDY